MAACGPVGLMCVLLLTLTIGSSVREASVGSSVSRMSFLVSVNLTWAKCIATAKTPLLPPDQPWNSTEPIAVGHCDKGPLTYTISIDHETGLLYVDATWYTSAIGIQAPSCRIAWNGTYLTPSSPSPADSLLPGCFISDSQEGADVTYYWMHILQWELSDNT